MKRLIVLTAIALVCATAVFFWRRERTHVRRDGAAAPTQRDIVLAEMARRTDGQWPRGTGHVVLAQPGSRLVEKGYHEPGGSFSPGVGSFGISIRVLRDGVVQSTSDSVPLKDVAQRFAWDGGSIVPAIVTMTPTYQAAWRSGATGATLDLESRGDTAHELEIVVRSTGPAGGPIRAIEWDGRQLTVNRRWTLAMTPVPATLAAGDEHRNTWKTIGSGPFSAMSDDGWLSVRFKSAGRQHLDVLDRAPRAAALPMPPAFPLDVEGSEESFTQSLNAQLAHLLMGLVGNETRPGDPTTYPLEWQRDGAFTVVALHRAGFTEVAERLLPAFVERDFFGGFGAEADAPGLALWAISEVSDAGTNPNRDAWLWPHVYRKAELILRMIGETRAIHVREPNGPLLPHLPDGDDPTLVSEPSKDGLIVGRMDQQRPVLYVSAVSYLGLVRAALLADRMGRAGDAARWRDAAARLRAAWAGAFQSPRFDNDRTYCSAMWPAAIVPDTDRPAFAALLTRRWEKTRDGAGGFKTVPLWTYFDVGEAHQWLALGRADRTWQTVSWFWNHQASPGLWTWWEGESDGDPFGTWHDVRGWVKPPHVTPHYWTSAEMALLQIDMLAMLDEGPDGRALVIGAGVQPAWLGRPMVVENVGTRIGPVSWRWDGQRVAVVVPDGSLRVRLGQAFPAGTPLSVEPRPSGAR